MATCVYDNFLTARRELWHNGEIISAISREFLESLPLGANIFFGFTVDRSFRDGFIYGDSTAIEYLSTLQHLKDFLIDVAI